MSNPKTNQPPEEALAANYLKKAHRMLQRWHGESVAPPDAYHVQALGKKIQTTTPWWIVQAVGSYLSRRGPNGGIEVRTISAFVDGLPRLCMEGSRAVEEAPEAWFPLAEKHFDPTSKEAPSWPKWFNVAPY